MTKLLVLCDSCSKNPENESHVCPYRSEICDDCETECNCCDECTHNCVESI